MSLSVFKKAINKILDKLFRDKRMGFCGKKVYFARKVSIAGLNNIYMYNNTNIYSGAKIICTRAKFIMKKILVQQKDLLL